MGQDGEGDEPPPRPQRARAPALRRAARNVVVLGPRRVGKTFLANARSTRRRRNGYRVLFRRAEMLPRRCARAPLRQLARRRDARALHGGPADHRRLRRRADGPRREPRRLPASSSIAPRRAATIVTSNRDTAEWIGAFADVLQAQRGVDRFINAAYDGVVVEGESLLAPAQAQRERRGPAAPAAGRQERRGGRFDGQARTSVGPADACPPRRRAGYADPPTGSTAATPRGMIAASRNTSPWSHDPEHRVVP
ncbi:MAG: ATP-binding protein [Sandaracinaceae bacterium]|nr:ATP-binding protein [Sandaracinaceae bacterium]